MGTTTAARIGRLLGRMAAGGLVVLVLVGLAANSTEAASRKDAVAKANEMIADCFRGGGEPEVIDTGGSDIWVECHYPDGGGTYYCSFLPGDTYCNTRANGRAVPDGAILPLKPVGGPLTRPGLIDRVESGGTVLAEDSATAGITATFLAGSAAAIGNDTAPAAEAAAPVAEPVTESVGEPVAVPVANPVEESVAAPVEEAVAEPIADAGTVARTAVVEEPAVAPAEDAVAEPVAAPGVQSVETPAAAPVVESVAPVTEPVEAVAPVESQVDAPADEPSDESA